MIAVTSALFPTVSLPAGAQSGAAPQAASPGTFTRTLTAFLDAHDAAPDLGSVQTATVGRQGSADDGKEAPPASDDGTPDEHEPAAGAIWLSSGLVTPVVPPALPPESDLTVSAPVGATVAATAVSSLLPQLAGSTPTAVPEPASAPSPLSDDATAAAPARPSPPTPGAPLLSPAQPPAIAENAPPTLAPQIVAVVQSSTPQTPLKTITPTRVAASVTPPATNAPAAPPIAVSATPQPAGQVFAAAIAAAGSWRDRDERSPGQDVSDASAKAGIAALLQIVDRAVVHATGDASGTSLDLTQDTGLHRMIDHIETLRDTASDRANAQDTRIRLVPDALGSVDVQVRQDGDRVHVSFTAQHDATAALIADAQPRLTQLAAERGVTLSGTSVATDSGNAQHQPRAAAPVIPSAPVSAASEPETSSDDRVA